MYPQVHFSPKSGITIFTQYSAADGIWLTSTDAYDVWKSRDIGEGTTPADARADFWASFHGHKNTARLYKDDCYSYVWSLYDGKNEVTFDDYAEAIEYAEDCEYVLR